MTKSFAHVVVHHDNRFCILNSKKLSLGFSHVSVELRQLCYSFRATRPFELCPLRVLCFLDYAPSDNLVNKTNLVHKLYYMFIAFLYMFRAILCPSSGENTVPMRHLVLVTVYRWLSGMQCGNSLRPAIPDSHLYTVTNTRCRIGTVFSPDDGHIVDRNM